MQRVRLADVESAAADRQDGIRRQDETWSRSTRTPWAATRTGIGVNRATTSCSRLSRVGIQVSHDHEGHAGLLRHAAEKPLQCFHAGGGGANADDRYHRISGHRGT